MAITLRTFSSGDTDYIAKHNQNMVAIEAALNALQGQIASAAGAGSAISSGQLIAGLFNNADGLVGPDSYVVTQGSTSVTVAAGTMYLADSSTVVTALLPSILSFVGLLAGTKYITVDAVGNPAIATSLTSGAVYSVVWNGSAFTGTPIRIAPVMIDAAESTAARHSDNPSPDVTYETLDDRLEDIEESVTTVAADAAEAVEIANEAKAQIENVVGVATRYRKVGVTIDAVTGLKGMIQVDFEGTIVGWSIIADAVGSVSVEVSKLASSAPPSAPSIPDATTNKISASAPIALSSAQSAASAESGVSTWTTAVAQWDVVQFKVASISTLTRATLYIRILEASPEQSVTTGTITSGSSVEAPFSVVQV